MYVCVCVCVCLCLYVCVSACVCVCVLGGWGGEGGVQRNQCSFKVTVKYT